MDPIEITVEIVRDTPFKKAAKEAIIDEVLGEFKGGSSVELTDSYYVERRSILEPQAFAMVLHVIADAVTIAVGLVSLWQDSKRQGKVTQSRRNQTWTRAGDNC